MTNTTNLLSHEIPGTIIPKISGKICDQETASDWDGIPRLVKKPQVGRVASDVQKPSMLAKKP